MAPFSLPAMAEEEVLSVHSLNPTQGSEGTAVEILGEDFSDRLDDHLVFVHDPAREVGVVFEGVSVHPHDTSLDVWKGTVGAAPAVLSGALSLWRGQRISLRPEPFNGESGLFQIRRADWFEATKSASWTQDFFVDTASPNTAAAWNDATSLLLDLGKIKFIPPEIELKVVIDGGSATGETPTGGSGSGKIIHFEVQVQSLHILDDDLPTFAQDLATLLKSTLGVFGLEAEADGSKVRISRRDHERTLGFATLSWALSEP